MPVNYQATGGTEYKVAFIPEYMGTEAALKAYAAGGYYNLDSFKKFPRNPASSWAGQTDGLFAVAVCVGTCTDEPNPPTPPPGTGAWYYSGGGVYDGEDYAGSYAQDVTIGGSGPVTISRIAMKVTGANDVAVKLALYDGGAGTTLLADGGVAQHVYKDNYWVVRPVSYTAAGGGTYKVAYDFDWRGGAGVAVKTVGSGGYYNPTGTYASFPANPSGAWSASTETLAVAICAGGTCDTGPGTPPSGTWYYSAGGPGGYNDVDWAGTYGSDVTIGGSGPVNISQIAVKIADGQGCPWKLALYTGGAGTTLLANGGESGAVNGAQWLTAPVNYQATGGGTYNVAYSPGCGGTTVAVNTNAPGGYYNGDSYGSFPLNSSGAWGVSTETLAVAICAGTCITGP
jgi:hypothetical protein